MIRTEISRDKTCQKFFSLSLWFLLVAFTCTNAGMAQEAILQASPTSEYAELIKSRLDKALRLTGKGFVRLNIELNQVGEVTSNDNYFHCTTDNQENILEALSKAQPFGNYPIANYGLSKFGIVIDWSTSRRHPHHKISVQQIYVE